MHIRPSVPGAVIVALDPGDLVVPVDVTGRAVGPVKTMARDGISLRAEWTWDELPGLDEVTNPDGTNWFAIGFSALDPIDPRIVVFTSWAGAEMSPGDTFSVIEQTG